MEKNKEWLKETLKKRMEYWELNVAGGDYGRGRSDETRELLKAIDQLEEPYEIELLEPSAWKTIAKLYHPNEVYWGNVRDSYIESLDEPEQEKVVVNEVMAGHIENCKNLKLTLSDSLHLVVSGDKQEEVLFARAWLDGYTVEKEKLYKIKLSEYDYLVQDEDGTVFTMDTNLHEYKTKFTEQEIKTIDERFWAFAEETTK